MITVLIKAGGLLTDYVKPDAGTYARKVEARDGATLRQILEAIGVPPGHVAMATANGGKVPLDDAPKDGDEISLLPPVQGG
jgi:molybdopterin converting factor small subunit